MGKKHHWLPLLLAAGLVAGSFLSGCAREPSLLQRPKNEPQIKAFFDAKEAQARQLVKQENKELPPEIWPYFAAGKKGDWATVTNLYAQIANRTYDSKYDKRIKVGLQSMSWTPIAETYHFYLQCTQPDSKLALALGEEIMRVVPRGSIYYGDTEIGRYIPTAFCRDHAGGDPFFVLTQNALADGLYLSYLQNMFGTKIRSLTQQDSKEAFDEYIQDAVKRMQAGQLQTNENGQETKVVTAINSRLSEIMFGRNADREFYVCEDSPTAWMYSHLTPHGPIMKVNREKLGELRPEIVQRDREYWEKAIVPLIGNWLTEETSLTAVCAFAEKIYVRQDFSGFTGDANYTRMTTFERTLPEYQPAAMAWSKCRLAIAGVYAWRMNDCAAQIKHIQALSSGETNTKQVDIKRLSAEQQRYLKEADYSYRQAFALNPSSSETVHRYSSLLTSLNRHAEALTLVRMAKKLNPEGMSDLEAKLVHQQTKP